MQVPDPTKINILHFMFYGRRHLKLEMPRFIFLQVTQIHNFSSFNNLFKKKLSLCESKRYPSFHKKIYGHFNFAISWLAILNGIVEAKWKSICLPWLRLSISNI